MEDFKMIELYQRKVSDSELSSALTRLDEFEITIDKDIVNKDKKMLQEFIKKSHNDINTRNIRTLDKYLDKLLKSCNNEESKLEICWTTSKDNKLPYTYPVSIVNYPTYSINSCNYISLGENDKLIEINLLPLCNLIAFELMYKDFGETHESIEELLKDYNLIAIHDSSVFNDLLKDCSPEMSIYDMAQHMRIEDCAYKTFETGEVNDYFYSTRFKTNRYSEVVNYSCHYAAILIANSIIKGYLRAVKDYKMLMISDTSIAFVVTTDKDINVNDVVEPISVRLFGRKFLVRPEVNVF